MAQHLIIDDAMVNLPTGPQTLKAGQIVDDASSDVATMQAQGVPMVTYNPATMGTVLAQYRASPTQRSLLALMAAAGLL